jgi:hypothetical protein
VRQIERLVPTRDHGLAVPSKERPVIATGDPQPGNRNDCTAYATRDGSSTHRHIRGPVEHALADMKTWTILA